MKIKNICCIGAGYVGGPTMAVIALKCPFINITVVDTNQDKIKAWNGSFDTLPVYEPGLAEIIEKTRDKNLFFSNDIAGNIQNSEMIFIAVNTPVKMEGEGAGMAADLRFIEACAHDIAKYSKSDKIVIEKSTVPIRTAEKIKEILDAKSSLVHFEILSNPEFLAEGTAISDMKSPDRILIGGNQTESGQKAIKKLAEIYSTWIPQERIITTNLWSSELSKLSSNAMLAQRVSSINSLSALCEKTGANIDELSKAIGMDHRIGPHFLKSSVGFGGSCFQKDILNLTYLCKFYGLNEVAEYWHQVVKINDYQKDRFAKKIIDYCGGDLTGKRIVVLGWAFKANTNDSRESAAIYVTEKLFNAGAIIEVYDPLGSKEKIVKDINFYWRTPVHNFDERIIVLKTKPSFQEVDISVILTEWDEFKNFDYDKSIVFDGRNILKKSFYSIGK
ncbi:nucleotide sugar dehydrogenase [Flavobacteriaceae bacterium]|nr:nucleotide sugar dehydrogenase [Flavobacteriaceae bacterium]